MRPIHRNIPGGLLVFMRIDCHDDGLEDGLTIEQAIDFCKDTKAAGVDVLNITQGNIVNDEGNTYEVPPVDIPNGINVDAPESAGKPACWSYPAGGSIRRSWRKRFWNRTRPIWRSWPAPGGLGVLQ